MLMNNETTTPILRKQPWERMARHSREELLEVKPQRRLGRVALAVLAILLVILFLPGGLSSLVPRWRTPRVDPDVRGPELPPLPPAGTPVLTLSGLGKSYGGVHAVRSVDLDLRSGEVLGLIGPNGAGKSTILSLCGAHQFPTHGSVDVLGHRLGHVEIRRLRESIGQVNPRHPLRSPLTIREVVLTGATGTTELMDRQKPDAETVARADELIEMLGLTDEPIEAGGVVHGFDPQLLTYTDDADLVSRTSAAELGRLFLSGSSNAPISALSSRAPWDRPSSRGGGSSLN